MRNVDIWIHEHLTSIVETLKDPTITNAVLTAVVLINIPGFQDVHDLIFGVFDTHPVSQFMRRTDILWSMGNICQVPTIPF